MMHDMMGWMLGGMGLIGLLLIAVLVLALAALIKYLFSTGRAPDRSITNGEVP